MSSSMVLGSDHSITGLNLGEDLQTRNDHHRHHHHHHHGQTAPAATVRSSSSSGSGGTNGTNTNSRRKSSRGTNDGCKKKPPQRGMGVAQLERLRLQERWKKITQINPPCPSTSTTSSSSSCLTNTSPLLLPTGTIDTSVFSPESTTKAQFPKFRGFGNGVVSGGSNLLQQQQQQGFHGQGFVSADHHHHHDLIQGYLYGIGNMISNGGNSKELPSTPKVVNKCFTHDHCSDCHKKKRTFNGENLMFNEINKYGINSHSGVGGCDFTGLSIGVKGGGDHHFDQKKTPLLLQSGISSMGFCNTESLEVEMVDVQQKKGNSESVGMINQNRGGGKVMEYEFFPSSGKGCYRSNGVISNNEHDDDHHDNQLLMMRKSSQEESVLLVMGCGGEGGGGEGEGGDGFYSKSCFATTASTTATATTTIISGSRTAAGAGYTGDGSVDASTSIDLSLRLSY